MSAHVFLPSACSATWRHPQGQQLQICHADDEAEHLDRCWTTRDGLFFFIYHQLNQKKYETGHRIQEYVNVLFFPNHLHTNQDIRQHLTAKTLHWHHQLPQHLQSTAPSRPGEASAPAASQIEFRHQIMFKISPKSRVRGVAISQFVAGWYFGQSLKWSMNSNCCTSIEIGQTQ